MPVKPHDPVRRADTQSRWYRRKYTREDREHREVAAEIVKDLNAMARAACDREVVRTRAKRETLVRRAARVRSTLAELEAVKAQGLAARLAQLAKEKHQGYSGNLNLSRR